MGMPQIPDGKNRPSFNETLIDLLESIALEEMALSHIMNAEGEKLQELIRKFYCQEINFCELEYSCKNMQGMINSLIMKEWLLVNKLGTIMEVNHQMNTQMQEDRVTMQMPKSPPSPQYPKTYKEQREEPPFYDQRKNDQNVYMPQNTSQGQYPLNYGSCQCKSTRCDIKYEDYYKKK